MAEPLTADRIAARLDALWAPSNVELAILFGSHATGWATHSSDIDIGVCAAAGTDIAGLRERLVTALGRADIDLVDLSRASSLLAACVARDGRVLFERTPGRFAAFASLAMRRFADDAELRKLQARAIHLFLQERGLR